MRTKTLFLGIFAVLLAFTAGSGWTQSISLSFNQGQVALNFQNAPQGSFSTIFVGSDPFIPNAWIDGQLHPTTGSGSHIFNMPAGGRWYTGILRLPDWTEVKTIAVYAEFGVAPQITLSAIQEGNFIRVYYSGVPATYAGGNIAVALAYGIGGNSVGDFPKILPYAPSGSAVFEMKLGTQFYTPIFILVDGFETHGAMIQATYGQQPVSTPVYVPPTATPTVNVPVPTATATFTQIPVVPATPTPTPTKAAPQATNTPTNVPTPVYDPSVQVPTDLKVEPNQPVWNQYTFKAQSREPGVRFSLYSMEENQNGELSDPLYLGSVQVDSSESTKQVVVPVSDMVLNRIYFFTAEAVRNGNFSAVATSEKFVVGPTYFKALVSEQGIEISWPQVGSKTILQLWHIVYDAYAVEERAEPVENGDVLLSGDKTSYLFGAEQYDLVPGDDYFIMIVGEVDGIMSNALWTPPITHQAGAFPRDKNKPRLYILKLEPLTEMPFAPLTSTNMN